MLASGLELAEHNLSGGDQAAQDSLPLGLGKPNGLLALPAHLVEDSFGLALDLEGELARTGHASLPLLVGFALRLLRFCVGHAEDFGHAGGDRPYASSRA